MFGQELKDGDLAKIVGGTLTPEAEAWVKTHKKTVIERAGKMGYLADFALSIVKADTKVYDVAALKKAINDYGINVDDLN